MRKPKRPLVYSARLNGQEIKGTEIALVHRHQRNKLRDRLIRSDRYPRALSALQLAVDARQDNSGAIPDSGIDVELTNRQWKTVKLALKNCVEYRGNNIGDDTQTVASELLGRLATNPPQLQLACDATGSASSAQS